MRMMITIMIILVFIIDGEKRAFLSHRKSAAGARYPRRGFTSIRIATAERMLLTGKDPIGVKQLRCVAAAAIADDLVVPVVLPIGTNGPPRMIASLLVLLPERKQSAR
jgi:hypothetical protein